jgi:hypothetical protein
VYVYGKNGLFFGEASGNLNLGYSNDGPPYPNVLFLIFGVYLTCPYSIL